MTLTITITYDLLETSWTDGIRQWINSSVEVSDKERRQRVSSLPLLSLCLSLRSNLLSQTPLSSVDFVTLTENYSISCSIGSAKNTVGNKMWHRVTSGVIFLLSLSP